MATGTSALVAIAMNHFARFVRFAVMNTGTIVGRDALSLVQNQVGGTRTSRPTWPSAMRGVEKMERLTGWLALGQILRWD